MRTQTRLGQSAKRTHTKKGVAITSKTRGVEEHICRPVSAGVCKVLKSIYAVASKHSAQREGKHLKQNIIGILGAIIAFVSVVLPWWTMIVSTSTLGYSFSTDVSIYPYQATANGFGVSSPLSIDIWYGWAALVLVLIGGVLGIAGSLAQRTRMILVAGGLIALLSVIIFAVGLQSELSKSAVVTGYPMVSLFSTGSFLGYANYTTYLSFGFWLALVAAIVMLAASRKKLEISAPPAVPPLSPA